MIEQIKSKIIEALKNSYFSNHYPDIHTYQGLDVIEYLESTTLYKPLIIVSSNRTRFSRVGLHSHTAFPSYTIRFINNDYTRNKSEFFDYDVIVPKCNEILLNEDLGFGTILNPIEIAPFTIDSAEHYDMEYKRIVEIIYNTHYSLD